MRAKEWNAVHAGHKIRVAVYTNGAELFINDELADTTNDLYASEGEPNLVGVFGEHDEFQVGAHIAPIEIPLAEIRINGQRIAGDLPVAIGVSA
jgi:hypothetical protein